MSESSLVLLLALAIEAVVGDPVSRWHPVALFGALVDRLFTRPANRVRSSVSVPPSEPRNIPSTAELFYGGIATVATVAVVGLGSALALAVVGSANAVLGLVVGAVLLKAAFSVRQLAEEAQRVAGHLDLGNVTEARHALRTLVSRDTSDLSPDLAASAAVESVAENLSDSYVAPLFYFVLFGVPGALAYRAINTLDAQVGYHGRYEALGKVAARLDDAANLIPARLSALLLVSASALLRANPLGATRTAWNHHTRAASPNAGWPMAAMAGALGVYLEKPGHYGMGVPGGACTAATIRRSISIFRVAVLLTSIAALAAVWTPR